MSRILVVEDDEDTRSAVECVLMSAGYEVDTAENGLEGLDRLHGLYNYEKPDLVLLDMRMPVLDGWKFVQAKNSDQLVRGIPVIVLTGMQDKENGCSIVNTTRIMHKPVSAEALLEAVDGVFRPNSD